MRILWLTTDRSKRALQFYNHLRLAIEAHPDVEMETIFRKVPNPVAGWANEAQEQQTLPAMTTAEHMNTYDFVFCDAFFAFFSEHWSHVTVPKGVLMGDQHGRLVEWYIGEAIRWRLKVFTIYRDALSTYWPSLRGEAFWLPCCADPELFRPYDEVERRPIVLGTGVLARTVYPVRTRAHERLSGQSWYERVERPRETAEGETEPRGLNYAHLLASARMALSCVSCHRYTVSKAYEIPAAGTVLVTDALPEMADLGFAAGENYIHLDPGRPDFSAHLCDLLDDPWLLDRVAAAGRELIVERHTYQHRADLFLTYVEDLLRLHRAGIR